MGVVQQMRVGSYGFAHSLEQARCVTQILFGAPIVLARQVTVGGFVHSAIATHTVNFVQTWNAALCTNGQVAHLFVAQDFVHGFGGIATGGVGIGHDAGATAASQQLVKRLPSNFGFDVPQRCVDCGNGGHGDRASAPVSTFVEVLPDVFNLLRIAANQTGNHVLF